MDDNGKLYKNSRGKFLSFIGAISLAAIGFINSEAWIIAAVALLGPIWAYFVLAIVVTLLANGIILALETKANLKFLEKMRVRVLDRQKRVNPRLSKIMNIGKISGIIISAALVGALSTAFLIHALGYKRPHNYLLATVGSLLFCATWVTVYSGAIAAVKQFSKLL